MYNIPHHLCVDTPGESNENKAVFGDSIWLIPDNYVIGLMLRQREPFWPAGTYRESDHQPGHAGGKSRPFGQHNMENHQVNIHF